MNKSHLLIGIAAVMMFGCAGGGSVSGLTVATTNAAQGQAALDAALVLPSSSDPSSQLSEATYKLNTAYSQEPTPERAAGFAIASSAKTANDIAKLFGTSLTRSRGVISNSAARKIVELLAPWRREPGAPAAVLTPLDAMGLTVSQTSAQSRAYPDEPTPVQVKTALEATLDDMKRIVEVLSDSNVNALDSITFTIADPNGTASTDRVRLGKADLLYIRGNVQAVCLFIQSLLGYELTFSSANYSSSQTLSQEFGADANSGNSVSKDRLLPASPFLNLAGGGAAVLEAARTCGTLAASDLQASGGAILARGASTGAPRWFSESLGVLAADVQRQGTDLGLFLNDGGNVTVGGVSTTLRFGSFLSRGSSLRSFLPNFTVASSGGSFTFTPVASTDSNVQQDIASLFPAGLSFQPVTLDGSKTRLDVVAAFLEKVRGL